MKNYIKKSLLEVLKTEVPSIIYDAEAEKPAVYIPAGELLTLLETLKSDRFDFTRMENLTSVDYKTYFEMVYHLFSWEKNLWITVKVRLDDHDAPSLPSVTGVFPGVEFEEREVYDLMGISFEGHPDLRRVLLPENFEGHPLRKDYKQLMPPTVPKIQKGTHTSSPRTVSRKE